MTKNKYTVNFIGHTKINNIAKPMRWDINLLINVMLRIHSIFSCL